jgi:hypothetical protein
MTWEDTRWREESQTYVVDYTGAAPGLPCGIQQMG